MMEELIKKAKAITTLFIAPKFLHGAQFKKDFYDKYAPKITSYSGLGTNLMYLVENVEQLEKRLQDLTNWTTYSGNVDLELHFREDGYYLEASVWEGRPLDGSRTNLRFSLEFDHVGYDTLEYFAPHIERKFAHLLEDILEDREEQERKMKLKEIEKEMLL